MKVVQRLESKSEYIQRVSGSIGYANENVSRFSQGWRFLMRNFLKPIFSNKFIRYERVMADILFPALPPMKPRNLTVEKRRISGMNCAWMKPKGAPQDKAIFVIHGGGFVLGSIRSHGNLTARIADAANINALVFEYSRAPEAQHPTALNEIVNLYEELIKSIPADHIVLAGDSCGGFFALSLLHELREREVPLPRACVLISPVTDPTCHFKSMDTMTTTDPMLSKKWMKEIHRLYNPGLDYSPLEFDYKGMPPMLIHVGEVEVMLDDVLALYHKCTKEEVEVTLKLFPHMWHLFHLHAPLMRESKEAIKEVGAFIREHIADL